MSRWYPPKPDVFFWIHVILLLVFLYNDIQTNPQFTEPDRILWHVVLGAGTVFVLLVIEIVGYLLVPNFRTGLSTVTAWTYFVLLSLFLVYGFSNGNRNEQGLRNVASVTYLFLLSIILTIVEIYQGRRLDWKDLL